MSNKVMLAVGVGALILGAAFFLMRIGTSQPGPADAPDTGSLQEELNVIRKESEEFKAQIAGLQEQLGASGTEAVPAAGETTPGGGKAPEAEASLSPFEKLRKKLGFDFEEFAKLMAKMIKSEKEGRGPGGMMDNPEMLEVWADMLKLMAGLQKELGVSMQFPGGRLPMSFIMEPLCKELGVELSPEESQKLETIRTRLIEKLLQVKEDKTLFEVEKAYGRKVAMREFNKEFEDLLTAERKSKLGSFGMGFGMGPGMGSSEWMSTPYGRPEKADEMAQAWQKTFGIDKDKHTGTLTTIAQEYLASYEDFERKYGAGESEREQLEEFILRGEGVERTFGETRGLTDQQREEKERELVDLEADTLRKISQLELTEDQQESVRNHNPFSPWAVMRRRSYGSSAQEAIAISNLRTLSSAQELYNARHERYAETLDELIKEQYIDSSLQGEKSGYTYELTTVSKDEWSAIATPSDWSKKHFYIDQTGVIRYEEGRSAGPDSPDLGSNR